MKNNKGITLVALIITIAILLIISVVTLSAFSNSETSILESAKKARNDYQSESGKENGNIEDMKNQLSDVESFINGETQTEEKEEQ